MEYCVCSCYFSDNIFLHKYTLHVAYHTEEQFLEDYEEPLRSRGCEGKAQLKQALRDVLGEVERRRNGGKDHVERCKLIKQSYKPLHQLVYALQENYFEPEFLRAVSYARSGHSTPERLVQLIQEEEAANTYSFPVFTREFCVRLMEELEHFEGTDLPRGRPNTMNRGGLLLSELGFDESFMDPLREHYLMPIACLLYPGWVGEGLDSHRAFIVKYTMESDVALSYHYDNAEVTLNVCLGTEFRDGDLYFGAMQTERDRVNHERQVRYQHVLGKGLLHRAQHMHGAHPISSGVRYNLIIWMRASSVRNTLCPMCNKPPTLVPNLGYGDGFTVHQ